MSGTPCRVGPGRAVQWGMQSCMRLLWPPVYGTGQTIHCSSPCSCSYKWALKKDGAWFCKLCCMHSLNAKNTKGSPFSQPGGAAERISRPLGAFSDHVRQCKMHTLAIDLEKQARRGPMEACVSAAERTASAACNTAFQTAYSCGEAALPEG